MTLKIACAGLLLMSAGACATGGPAIESGCEWTKPIWLSRLDVLTSDTERQILEHNEAGARICGWTPRSGAAAP